MKGTFVLFAGLLPACGTPAHAGAVRAPHSEAELITEHGTATPGEALWAAVRLKPDEGWHIYWSNPGDSGTAPEVEWRLPEGFEASPIRWPYPRRIEVPPLVNYGYEEEVLLLSRLKVPGALRPGARVTLSARAEWLVCNEVCLPAAADLSASLRAGPAPGPADPRFQAARRRLPVAPRGWRLDARPDGDFIVLSVRPPPGASLPRSSMRFFPREPLVIENAAPQEASRDDDGTARVRLHASKAASVLPGRLRGVLVSEDGWSGRKALRVDVPLRSARTRSLLASILMALAGGLLLNLMPCVFPVLSLKLLSFVRQSAGSAADLRRHGLAFAGGVIVSFWALAGALLALRAAGQQIGWGFQLQSPAFVAFLAALFFLLGLSLLGVFEIGASWASWGAGGTRREGYAGSLMGGVLATLVATPCTAPFMGTALGYALTVPAGAALAVFSALGIGMSAPYVALSFKPGWLRRLPKPGPWMESFKQLIAFPLLATVVWLGWVHAQQTGAQGTLRLLSGLWLMGLGAWLLGRWGRPVDEKVRRLAARGAAAALLFLGLGAAMTAPPFAETPALLAKNADSAIPWRPYSDEGLAKLRRRGRPVFLDFTAAWCVTCQVNERVALGSDEVARAFREKGVAALRADWTSRDPAVTRALARYGRSGVPLYVLYGPSADAPAAILPAVLTPGIVLDALREIPAAKGGPI
ncbi:MAG: thioredoxin family protein [Elusimicrobiota bacterium]